MIAIAVTTCEREEPTLNRSLASLKNILKGSHHITVVEDVDRQLGCFKSYDRALRTAIDMMQDYVLVVPDDMLYIEDWEPIQPHIKDSEVGYVALYTPKGLGERLSFSKGINKVKGGWASSWGGCYLMRREVAEQVIEHPFYQAHLNGNLNPKNYFNYAFNKRIDHCIPEVVHQLGLKQLFYAPSLCKHIGYTSTIGHKHTEHENRFNP